MMYITYEKWPTAKEQGQKCFSGNNNAAYNANNMIIL